MQRSEAGFSALTYREAPASLAEVSARKWMLAKCGEADSGDCFVVDASDARRPLAVAFLNGTTCDVFACVPAELPPLWGSNPANSEGVQGAPAAVTDPDVLAALFEQARASMSLDPAVHMIGSPEDASGQVTVQQEQGNYLRICNWDRISSNAPLLKGAKLRTLPQCGCGGSLGTPKLFGSFAEMGVYHFCAFHYLAK